MERGIQGTTCWKRTCHFGRHHLYSIIGADTPDSQLVRIILLRLILLYNIGCNIDQINHPAAGASSLVLHVGGYTNLVDHTIVASLMTGCLVGDIA